jgi:hypothetical protein
MEANNRRKLTQSSLLVFLDPVPRENNQSLNDVPEFQLPPVSTPSHQGLISDKADLLANDHGKTEERVEPKERSEMIRDTEGGFPAEEESKGEVIFRGEIPPDQSNGVASSDILATKSSHTEYTAEKKRHAVKEKPLQNVSTRSKHQRKTTLGTFALKFLLLTPC